MQIIKLVISFNNLFCLMTTKELL